MHLYFSNPLFSYFLYNFLSPLDLFPVAYLLFPSQDAILFVLYDSLYDVLNCVECALQLSSYV